MVSLGRRAVAEMVGTGWLVLGGCGTAVLSAGVPQVGVGILGVALAFGLSVVTMAYALGRISGAHFNPAVTVGLAACGRFPRREILAYVGAQVVGAVLGAAVIALIARSLPGFDISAGFATNGYGAHSPGGFSLAACFLCEVVMTAVFLMVVLGATDERAPTALAPLAIGLTLTLIHLVSIPVTNTSVNPARSTGVALFQGGWAMQQLWLFWLAPLAGGLLGGIGWRALAAGEVEPELWPETGPVGEGRPVIVP
jgi:aquaporin Z